MDITGTSEDASFCTEDGTLSNVFGQCWKVYSKVDAGETRSSELQPVIAKGLELGEIAVGMVNQLSLFSQNEEINEVSTSHIRYMVLPALLGFFSDKLKHHDRAETLKKVQIYYKDFLRICRLYHLTTEDVSNEDWLNQQQSLSPEKTRELKIRAHKEESARRIRLKTLQKQLNSEHVDEEIQREYYLTEVQSWIHRACVELRSIDEELKILEHMSKMRKEQPAEVKSKPVHKEPPKLPFIITRDRLQAGVFGAGYPSLPVYSLEEFYEHQLQQGNVPTRNADTNTGKNERESEEKRAEAAENETPESLAKARSWDDWKDDHRRGWGNRHNMG